jgi:hypothetical protein
MILVTQTGPDAVQRPAWMVLLRDFLFHTLLVLFVGVPLVVVPGFWIMFRLWNSCGFGSRLAASWTVGVIALLVLCGILMVRLRFKGASKGRMAVSLLPALFVVGFAFGWVAPDFLRAWDRACSRGTISCIRSLSTAIESYKVDQGSYPLLGDPEELAQLLEDLDYAKSREWCDLQRDRWGNPFVVDTNGREYVIVSHGRCGVPEQEDPWTYPCGELVEFEQDMLYRNGAFQRWPCCSNTGSEPAPSPCWPGTSGPPSDGRTVLGWGGGEDSDGR